MSYRENSPVEEFSTLPGQVDPKLDILSARTDVVSKQPITSKRRPMKQAIKWMKLPLGLVPPFSGLEFLIDLDTLLIQQDLPSSNGENRYYFRNEDGETLYRSQETYYENMRIGIGTSYGPGYILQLIDETGQEIVRFNRPVRKAACCWCACKTCEACAHTVIVEAGNEIIGYIGQTTSCWKPYITISDSKKKKRYRIRGPCCFGDKMNTFNIFTAEYGSYCGKIDNKRRPNTITTDETLVADYEITFPATLDVKSKMLQLAALYLIDSIFFEARVNED